MIQGYELLQQRLDALKLSGAVYADSTAYTTLCNDRINTYSALPFLSRNLHRNILFRRQEVSLRGMAEVSYH